MLPGTIRPLTDRQRAVMERIDKRIPIKVIALELGVSETRINQHIRALKDLYSAASLAQLVKNYRLSQGRSEDDPEADGAIVPMPIPDPIAAPLSEPLYIKNQIPETYPALDEWPRDDVGKLVVGDVMPLGASNGWLTPAEPKVVPGLLEGEHAVLLRSLAVLFIAIGILMAVVLSVTAAVALSSAMDGKAHLPADQWQGPA
jgi:DNA-binding CsgD family transcriptional regulator